MNVQRYRPSAPADDRLERLAGEVAAEDQDVGAVDRRRR